MGDFSPIRWDKASKRWEGFPERPKQGVFQSFAAYSAELSRWRNDRNWAFIMGPELPALCPDFGHVVVSSPSGDETCLYCDYFRCIDCDRMVKDTGWAHVKCARHGDIGPPPHGACSDCDVYVTDGVRQRVCTGGSVCSQFSGLRPESAPLPPMEHPNISREKIAESKRRLKAAEQELKHQLGYLSPHPMTAKRRAKLLKALLDKELSNQ